MPLEAAADITAELLFGLQLDDKLVEIVTPSAYFIWPESGAFVKPVTIRFVNNCGFYCLPAAYFGDGQLHMDMKIGRASVRAMELTNRRDQPFSSRSAFSLNDRQQNRFVDQEAQVIGGFGTADAERASALLGHFSTD